MPDIETVEEQTVFEGPRFAVRHGAYRHGQDAEPVERDYVAVKDAAAIVAYDDTHLHLVRQPREAIGRSDVIELPAGLIDEDDASPLAAAQRELREELGLEADTWTQATNYFSSSGFTDELVYVFLATDLRRVGEADPGGAERIEPVTWPLDELDSLIDLDVDAKTLIGLLWLRRAQLLGGSAGTGPPVGSDGA
jgi:ADP-ribose pyrophosphatase